MVVSEYSLILPGYSLLALVSKVSCICALVPLLTSLLLVCTTRPTATYPLESRTRSLTAILP
jgi:hypothetical protein